MAEFKQGQKKQKTEHSVQQRSAQQETSDLAYESSSPTVQQPGSPPSLRRQLAAAARLRRQADKKQVSPTASLQRLAKRRGLTLQTQMTVTAAGDQYEQEADAMASQVVERLQAPSDPPPKANGVQRQDEEEEELQAKPLSDNISRLQRQEAKDEELQMQRQEEEEEEELQMQRQEEEELQMQRQEGEEEELQAKSAPIGREGGTVDSATADAIQQERGGGQALPGEVRNPMERAFGADFGGVRVHSGSRSDQLNRAVSARAFTTGSDIFFRQGAYEPHSRSGQELLAHELTHVVQQNGAGANRSTASRTTQRDTSLQAMLQRRTEQSVIVTNDKTGLRKKVKKGSRGGHDSILHGETRLDVQAGEQLVIDKDKRFTSRMKDDDGSFDSDPQTIWYHVLKIANREDPEYQTVVEEQRIYLRSGTYLEMPGSSNGEDSDPENVSQQLEAIGERVGKMVVDTVAQIEAEGNEQEPSTLSKVLSGVKKTGNWIIDNSKTTPETGLPGWATAPTDVYGTLDNIHQHVSGKGDELRTSAIETAENPPDPTWSDQLGDIAGGWTFAADTAEVLRSGYSSIKSAPKWWKARKNKDKSGKRKYGRKMKKGAATAGTALLNGAKYVGTLLSSLGGSIIGLGASLVSYVRNLRQMARSEEAWLELREIKVQNGYPELAEAVRTARKKKRRRFGRKLLSALSAGSGTALGVGGIVALATGGVAAAAALAVTPVGIALAAVGLTIGLGLASYAIFRKIFKKVKGKKKVAQRGRVATYLHDVLNQQRGDRYERDTAKLVITALGLEEEECVGDSGKDNIMDKLGST